MLPVPTRHSGECYQQPHSVMQRQQSSQARNMQMQASTAKACRKPIMARQSHRIYASSSVAVAERPIIDLDLQGADFCGSEGVLTYHCLIAPVEVDSCHHVAHRRYIYRSHSAERSSPSTTSIGRRRQEVPHTYLWLPGMLCSSLSLSCPSRTVHLHAAREDIWHASQGLQRPLSVVLHCRRCADEV